MSLSDTIDAIIKESTEVERELRWFMSALPAIVSTDVCRKKQTRNVEPKWNSTSDRVEYRVNVFH